MANRSESPQARRDAVARAMEALVDRVSERSAARVMNEGARDAKRIRRILREEFVRLADLIDATGYVELGARLAPDEDSDA